MSEPVIPTRSFLERVDAAISGPNRLPNRNLEERISGNIVPFVITGDWEKRTNDVTGVTESVYSAPAHLLFFDGTTYQEDVDGTTFYLYSPRDGEDQPDYTSGDKVHAVARGTNWEIIGGGGTPHTKAVAFNTLIKNSGGYVESGEFVDTSLLDAGLAVEPQSEILTTGTLLKHATKRSIYTALIAPSISHNATTNVVSISSTVTNLATGQTLYVNYRTGKRTRLTTFTKSAYSGAITLSGVNFPCWIEAYMSGSLADNGLLLATANGSAKSIPSPLTRYKVTSGNTDWSNAATRNTLAVSRQPGAVSTSASRMSLQVNLASALSQLSYLDSSDYSFDYTWRKNGVTQYPENVAAKIGDTIYTPGEMESGTTTTFTLVLRAKFDDTTYGNWTVGAYVVTRS